MKRHLALSLAALFQSLLMIQTVAAGTLTLATEPMGSSTGSTVKPNMMFILDDSGSMSSDYMPDYVDDSRCAGSSGLTSCKLGDPPFSSVGYNKMYYDPKIRYKPPVDGAGASWADASTTAPLKDPFSTSTSTQGLTTYPDYAWCKYSDSTPTGNPATDPDCKYYQVGVAEPYPKYSGDHATYDNRRSYKSAVPYYYNMNGSIAWCKASDLSECQAKRSKNYTYPKFSGGAAVTGVAAYREFYIVSTSDATIDFICYNDNDSNTSCEGTNILSAPITVRSNSKVNRNKLADDIVAASLSGGFVATKIKSDDGTTNNTNPCKSDNTSKCAIIRITAPGGATSKTNASYNGKYLNLPEPSGINFDKAKEKLANGVNAQEASSGATFTRVEIKTGQTYTKYDDRDDCAGTTCSYEEELQNFANWYSYYRIRMLMTKTSISHAFKTVSDTTPGAGFRIGLQTISAGSTREKVVEEASGDGPCYDTNKALELSIGDFNTGNKTAFYTNLFNIKSCSWTPLRGALARAGQVYAGTGASDPIQFSCQQNFAFLATDGYWNTQIETDSFGPKRTDASTAVGNCDGATSADGTDADAACFPNTEKEIQDRLKKSNTLADVALYYYKSDLRPAMTNDVPTSSSDGNNKQHMVTFTLGLGVDGTIAYNKDYLTSGSADYTAIKQGTADWPDPINNSAEERIDDLWHAAVNGHGKYFSASNAKDVSSSLKEALLKATEMTGAAAAAATSNLEPIAGDNFAYVASYRTKYWDGNLESLEIDLTTGTLATCSSCWKSSDQLNAQISATTPTGSSGPGSRNLFTFDSSITGTDKKLALTWANMTDKSWTGKFDPTQLTQCSTLSNCPGATSENLFNFLMGAADATTNKSYRTRTYVLGDIVNTQPVYVGKPSFGYIDSGYATFKSTSRSSMVYVSANDGFMHAFDATSGSEKWAFAPSPVLDSLFKLASPTYAHQYYVDGVLTVGDVYVSSAWKTVAVGGMGAGGNNYFALDITNPDSPLVLWQFSDANMGKAMGNAIIAKLPEGATSSAGAAIAGKWVAILTSGYNSGEVGRIYVLDVYTGAKYFEIKSCIDQSSAATCSATSNGIAKMNAWADNPSSDNTALQVYAGDLDGDLWRFDLKLKTAFKVAAIGEPITVKPELAEVSGKRAIFFGTGIFLQTTDRSDAIKRSIYGIKDELTATETLADVKNSGALVEQTMAVMSSNSNKRNIPSPQTVDWSSKSGWFVELLDTGERVNVDPKIQLGTLVIASNVPDATSSNSCTVGGHSWLNFLDIRTGSYVENSQSNADAMASTKIGNALAVGTNIIKLPNGKLVTITTTSDNKHDSEEAPVSSANLGTKRVLWRELIND